MKMLLLRAVFLAALVSATLGATHLGAADSPDEAAIRRLNDDYLQSFLNCDVARYRELLAEDFRAVLSDGRLIDRTEFLRQAAVPPAVTTFHLDEILIRAYGNAAVVNGLVRYLKSDGAPVLSRYTATYVRAHGRWQIVATQFTRVPLPSK